MKWWSAIALAGALGATSCHARDEVAPAREPQKRANEPTATPHLSPDDDAVLVMYDAIADAFDKHADDCDAMGGELDAIVERSTPDVRRWAAAQTRLDAAERAAAADRLQAAAGPRIERAQTSIRLAMGKCPDSARFQSALSKLTALSPESP